MKAAERRALDQLQAALNAAQERARRAGEDEGFALALAAQAQAIARQDLADAAGWLEEAGPAAAVNLILDAMRARWAERWMRGLAPLLAEAVRRATAPRAALLGPFDVANPRMGEWFRRHAATVAAQIGGGSGDRAVEAIRAAQAEGLSAPQTRERLMGAGIADRGRAEKIARQELQRSSKGASNLQARESGLVKTRTRLSARDARVRDEHRRWDGETVGMDERYSSGETYPGETEFLCRCVEMYNLDYDLLNI